MVSKDIAMQLEVTSITSKSFFLSDNDNRTCNGKDYFGCMVNQDFFMDDNLLVTTFSEI